MRQESRLRAPVPSLVGVHSQSGPGANPGGTRRRLFLPMSYSSCTVPRAGRMHSDLHLANPVSLGLELRSESPGV